MAKAAHTTITRIPHQSDARVGQAARDWEDAVNDLTDFTDVTMQIAERCLDKHGDVLLSANEVRRMLFCVYQTHDAAVRFKTAYYAAIEA